MTAQHDLPTEELFAGRYKIVRVLGSGGMGTVYLANDTVLGGEEVALKILHLDRVADESHVQRFLREVQLTRRVTHPNVVRTFELGQVGEKLFFTMEVVHGTTLKEYAKKQSIDPHSVARLLAEISKGLHAIHEQGVIHRDLKLSNVMVAENGAVKIADFGVARPEVSDLTCTDEIVGSATHMSPEVWKGNPVSPATDLYSLGIMAYELLTHRLPFEAQSCHEMMWKHINATPTPPIEYAPEIPIWLDHIVVRLLAKEPTNRFNTAYALAEEIAFHLGDPTLLGSDRAATSTGAFSQAQVSAVADSAGLSHSFLEAPEGMQELPAVNTPPPQGNEPLVESAVTDSPVARTHAMPISILRLIAAACFSVFAFGLISSVIFILTAHFASGWGNALFATITLVAVMSFGYAFFCATPLYVAFTQRLGFKRGLLALAQSLLVVSTVILLLISAHALSLMLKYPELSSRSAALLSTSSERALADVWRAVIPTGVQPVVLRENSIVKVIQRDAPLDSHIWTWAVRSFIFLGLVAPLARRCRQRKQFKRLRILLMFVLAALVFAAVADIAISSPASIWTFGFGVFSHNIAVSTVIVTALTWLILFMSVAFSARLKQRTRVGDDFESHT